MNTIDKIIFCGDIHGEYSKLVYDLKRFRYEDANIIQVGDFGIGFYKPNYYKTELTKLNERLVIGNNHLYAIRGNHDNPEYFQQTNNPFDLSNITLLQDYSELTLCDKSILFVGGAVSVDRRFRHEGKNYWSDEEFVMNFEYPFGKYDIVVTHTRPGVCGAFKGFDNIKYWCDQDVDLKNDLIDESNAMNALYEKTKPLNWYYGHFHKSSVVTFENTTFRCLDINEHYMMP